MCLKELLENWFQKTKKQKQKLHHSCDNFFQPLSSGGQAKVTNADTTTNCIETTCSDSNCSEDSIFKSEPEASQMSIPESIET